MNLPHSPTSLLYSALQNAFDHFNTELFEGKLPHCMLTLRSANRINGYYHSGRFISPSGEKLDELGLHPGFFTLKPIEFVLSTLVHEMVHHWQYHFGTPTPSNAHNKEWAAKMEALGLMPSDTGLPGGKQTGRSISDYILPNGIFIITCNQLIKQGFVIPWLDRYLPALPESQVNVTQALKDAGIEYELSSPPINQLPVDISGKVAVVTPVKKLTDSRQRHTCPQCKAKAWASFGTKIICGVCNVPMQSDLEVLIAQN